MSSSRFTKLTKYNGEEKSTIMKNQNNPSVPSITPLFNLLALRNKLNPKSFIIVCVFISPHFFLFILYNIYLFTLYLKSVSYVQYISKNGKCYFWNWIEENFMTAKKYNVISIDHHIYPLDKSVSVPNCVQDKAYVSSGQLFNNHIDLMDRSCPLDRRFIQWITVSTVLKNRTQVTWMSSNTCRKDQKNNIS